MSDSKLLAPAAPRRKPPAAGMGRKKGVPNKTTAAVKAALQAVYADLQAETGEDHGHLLTWAKANATEFYRLWAKMLPTEVSGPDGGPLDVRTNVDLSGLTPEQLRALASIKLPADA